jgi:hypothetical protein
VTASYLKSSRARLLFVASPQTIFCPHAYTVTKADYAECDLEIDEGENDFKDIEYSKCLVASYFSSNCGSMEAHKFMLPLREWHREDCNDIAVE